jgi:hypothetical protein
MYEIILILIIVIFVLVYVIIKKPKKADKDDKKTMINTLVRQASRWATAAKQDKSPLISLLHANYGAGYLWALKDIFTDQEIEHATGMNVLEFRDEIVEIQDQANLKVIKLCPKFAPESSYLTVLAKEGACKF